MENINEIINKMKELKQKKELEILDNELQNINLDTDYQEDLNNNKSLLYDKQSKYQSIIEEKNIGGYFYG